jgi:hypothetical protein
MSEENYLAHQYEDPITTSSLPYIDTSPQLTDAPIPSAAQPIIPTVPIAPTAFTDIDQIAEAYQLGKIQKEYKNDASKDLAAGLSACIMGILCCIPLICVALYVTFYGGIVFFGTLGGAVFGLSSFAYGINRTNIAINKFLANIRFQNLRYYVCSHGIISIKGKQIQAVRWDQVQAIQKIYPANNSNIPQQYILYPADATKPVMLERLCIRIKPFRLQLEREITRRLFPEFLAAYKAGQTLNFGPVTVTSQGLSMHAGEKLLPWTKLGSIYEVSGCLVIRETGSRARWAAIEASEILNIGVLLALLQQIRR